MNEDVFSLSSDDFRNDELCNELVLDYLNCTRTAIYEL